MFNKFYATYRLKLVILNCLLHPIEKIKSNSKQYKNEANILLLQKIFCNPIRKRCVMHQKNG